MKKEDLVEKVYDYVRALSGSNNASDVSDFIDEFFKDKVIIQRGDTVQAMFGDEWGDVFTMSNNREYRIKPKEPIYEWQWYRIVNNHVEILNESSFDDIHQFFTEAEVNVNIWKKFEETKRERKQ